MKIEDYKREIWKIAKPYPTIIQKALLEVAAKRIEDVEPLDRSRLVNICKRRVPVKRLGHIVQAEAPLESRGYVISEEKTKYAIEKGVPDIEREDI